MNIEEILKELMGDAYKEDMSKNDVSAFFKKQVLSTGNYENVDKSKAEKKELNDKIAELQAQLEERMSDDDKKKKEEADTKKLIESLQKQLSESRANQSKMAALSVLAEAKIKAGIADDDADFDKFVTGISFEDSEKTSEISKYVSQIVSSAFEAGKSEAIKNKLGKMGSFKEGDGNSKDNADEGAFGKELAQLMKQDVGEQKNFFERK